MLKSGESAAERNYQHIEDKVPQALRTAGAWSWRVIAITIVATSLIWFSGQFSTILIALMVALLIAVVAEPVAAKMRNSFGWPPALAACLTLLLATLIVLLMLGASSTGIYQGFFDLRENVEDGIGTLVAWIGERFPNYEDQVTKFWSQLQSFVTNNSGRIAGGVLAISNSVTTFLTGAMVTFFALFFFLKDGRRLWQWCVRLFPAEYRDNVNESGIRIWVTVGNYTRTQAIVAIVDAIGVAAIAMLLGTPFSLSLPIAVLVFIGAFIPIVGALVSGSAAILVVLVNTGNIWMAVAMIVGVLLVQQIEGNLLQPILQGNALNMHPLAILLLVMAGSGVAGIVGALFVVPFSAAFNAVVLYLNGHDIYPYLDRDPNRPGGPKKPFSKYAQEHWKEFDEKVVQHESPKARKRLKKLAKKAENKAK
ncbi:AI-2E family transporter [Arcanobacterium hippocoleae]|uniref:PurR-regulated permease PerM n=1 Tax=Arcanobacterium hippocoleae TaxID=149017 RepID=A0ABU1T0P6_9ACTO|nr:AI-2E family transporter [Arcanobacterium hippocoleae]MDR6938948.1 putative PurR-regulated permease PerM [Arcanobacterium hippocoleae]